MSDRADNTNRQGDSPKRTNSEQASGWSVEDHRRRANLFTPSGGRSETARGSHKNDPGSHPDPNENPVKLPDRLNRPQETHYPLSQPASRKRGAEGVSLPTDPKLKRRQSSLASTASEVRHFANMDLESRNQSQQDAPVESRRQYKLTSDTRNQIRKMHESINKVILDLSDGYQKDNSATLKQWEILISLKKDFDPLVSSFVHDTFTASEHRRQDITAQEKVLETFTTLERQLQTARAEKSAMEKQRDFFIKGSKHDAIQKENCNVTENNDFFIKMHKSMQDGITSIDKQIEQLEKDLQIGRKRQKEANDTIKKCKDHLERLAKHRTEFQSTLQLSQRVIDYYESTIEEIQAQHSGDHSRNTDLQTSNKRDRARPPLPPLEGESYYRQLIPVTGDENDCAIRAMLVAAGHHPTAPHIEDTVREIGEMLESMGVRPRGEMINMGGESGYAMLAHLHSVDFFDSRRPVVVYSRDPDTGALRHVTAAGDPTGDPYYIFYDEQDLHYYGLRGPLQSVSDQQPDAPTGGTEPAESRDNPSNVRAGSLDEEASASDKRSPRDHSSRSQEQQSSQGGGDIEPLAETLLATFGRGETFNTIRTPISKEELRLLRSHFTKNKSTIDQAILKRAYNFIAYEQRKIIAAEKGTTVSEQQSERNKKKAARIGTTVGKMQYIHKKKSAERKGTTVGKIQYIHKKKSAAEKGTTVSKQERERNKKKAARIGTTVGKIQYEQEVQRKEHIREIQKLTGMDEQQIRQERSELEISYKDLREIHEQNKRLNDMIPSDKQKNTRDIGSPTGERGQEYDSPGFSNE